jgi:quercetin dioxygenase-like cupin family protein
LSTHSAPTPTLLYFLQGEADVRLGDEIVVGKAGSFVYMPPMLPHGISAKTSVMMLLVQVKNTMGDIGKAAREKEVSKCCRRKWEVPAELTRTEDFRSPGT